MSTKKPGRVMRPTMTTATYHRGKHLSLMQIAVLANKGKIHEIENIEGVFIPLSDPAALVEKVAVELLNYQISLFGMHGHNADAYFDNREAARRIAKRLGVPAKLLKERKKK